MELSADKEAGATLIAEKNWTILIYANGNNDLEPEMRQAMLNAEKVGSSPDVNVVIQLGRAESELVKIIRPTTTSKTAGGWSGVRRYFVATGSSTLVGNLKRVNMADPKTLYDFIIWGMNSYPADRYMLILGGHGYQCIGMMTDYSQKAPYIMGIPEMVRAIDMAANRMGKKIDILVSDTCYFNSVEVIYELGKDENHSVRSAVTPVKNGAIEGLPHDIIIELVRKNSNVKDTTAVIRELIDYLSYDLVAFEINHRKLKQIKQLFNDAALVYLASSTDTGNAPLKKTPDGLSNLTETMALSLMSTVIHFKRVSQSKLDLFIVVNRPTDDLELISRYCRLSFAQGNSWTYVLSNKQLDMNMAVEQKKNLSPLKMKPGEVYSYISIMNPELGEKRREEILNELYQYKKWH